MRSKPHIRYSAQTGRTFVREQSAGDWNRATARSGSEISLWWCLLPLEPTAAASPDGERIEGSKHTRRAIAPVPLPARDLDQNTGLDKLGDGTQRRWCSYPELALHER